MIRNWLVVAITAGATLTLQADDELARSDQLRQVPAKAFPGGFICCLRRSTPCNGAGSTIASRRS